MLPTLFKQLHINVFHEIVKGKFNPCLVQNTHNDALRNLVITANTIKATTLSETENPFEFIENNDFTIFGYRNTNDFDIDIVKLPSGKSDIFIKPLKIYDLHEVMDIPQYVSLKCTCYVEFMGDEFERIKIRAEKIYDTGTDEASIREYAGRHIQMTKKLFHDAKMELKSVQEKDNPENIYILFAANLFLVKIILFYQKMFQLFLNNTIDSEEKLFHEVIKILSLKKLCTIFPCRKTSFCNYIKKTYIEKAKQTEDQIDEMPVEYSESSCSKKTLPIDIKLPKYERIKVNGQINVFVDMFIQCLEEIEVPEGMFIETTRENLQNFLLANFNDKNDKPFNPYTINTILKPYRTDKHISSNSPKKIDVKKIFKKE